MPFYRTCDGHCQCTDRVGQIRSWRHEKIRLPVGDVRLASGTSRVIDERKDKHSQRLSALTNTGTLHRDLEDVYMVDRAGRWMCRAACRSRIDKAQVGAAKETDEIQVARGSRSDGRAVEDIAHLVRLDEFPNLRR